MLERMPASDSFLHKLRKIRKQLEDSQDHIRQRVRDAFHGSVPALPEALVDELFEHFDRRLAASAAGKSATTERSPHDELSRYEPLADVVDLLSQDYDENADPLQPEDWPVIRDVFSNYAGELNMRTVTYVMRLVVEHGAVEKRIADMRRRAYPELAGGA